MLLNDTERKRRATERLQEAEANGAPQPADRAARGPEPRPAAAERVVPQGKPRAKAAFEGPKVSAGDAARNQQAFEARRRQAEAHKAEVLERNAKRGKAPAADLPSPP
ncbi:hypothetical protein HK414_15520 [Ramlibacter terrae]|uniref:Translation initiation factor IF-2 n=1 Tax=Ramlibacter terrae TaxID=2732511 RepID=A0ABX6P627_9BURK|nr:hypothetical protein HK414_15520 [Ramlibacter terrae]